MVFSSETNNSISKLEGCGDMKYKIHFDNLSALQRFVAEASDLTCDVNLFDNHKCLDGKSIVALMNLDLKKDFLVEFITDDEDLLVTCQKIVKEILV